MEYKRLKFEECREQVSNIRRKVFIEEQNCPENMEWDENEEKDSLWFVAFRGDLAVGCLRLRDIEPNLLKMERVAVLKEYRRRGIASELIRNAMMYTGTEAVETSVYAYAQVSAIQAYISLGFTVLSKVWIEEGTFIPHQTIFWGTPSSIDLFLKNQSEKSDVTYEEYDVRSPLLRQKIEAFKQRLEELGTWNICSLHIHLNDKVISRIARKRFEKFCVRCSRFLEDFESSNVIEDEANFLLTLANTKLNTGHFNEVDENWRKLYALICFVESFLLFKMQKYKKAIGIADKGLCMGRIDENDVPLRQLAWLIHEQLVGVSDEKDSIHHSFCLGDNEEALLVPLKNSVPIEECEDDETTFERLVAAVHNGKPLLVRGFASNMPAVEKWNIPFLLGEMHSRTFPVEIGTKYSDEEWSQQMMTFRDFIKNSENQRLYLAQHRLFDQVPHLKRDVIIPDICFGESEHADHVDMNMWIGPAGTVSPLHTDPRKNMFVQVHGTKLFRMVAPEDSESVYPFDGMLSNTSQVDVENPDSSAFGEFSKIKVFDAAVRSGDALFIPQKWWHFVRSTTPSISVSFWFD